jgi:succinylglutamate desuccinylase
MDRLIGLHEGEKHGAMMICFGGLHGNEPAGVNALKTLFELLKDEPNKNPNFKFKGCLFGLIGNVRAFEKKVRFINKDLNRLWNIDFIHTLLTKDFDTLDEEEIELFENLKALQYIITKYNPTNIIVIDLHTTSAEGGIFTIVNNDKNTYSMAQSIQAPVVKGLVNEIGGTTLHYFNPQNFSKPIKAISFEAGQHDDPLSESRAIAAIVSCMRHEGMVQEHDVESKHDEILKKYSEGLPEIVNVAYKKSITPSDEFVMRPGYSNFQVIKKGEHLADDKNGPIYSTMDGYILMPLYQKQGNDGFFIVE